MFQTHTPSFSRASANMIASVALQASNPGNRWLKGTLSPERVASDFFITDGIRTVKDAELEDVLAHLTVLMETSYRYFSRAQGKYLRGWLRAFHKEALRLRTIYIEPRDADIEQLLRERFPED